MKTLFCLLSLTFAVFAAEPAKFLFFGSSSTYFHEMPANVAATLNGSGAASRL